MTTFYLNSLYNKYEHEIDTPNEYVVTIPLNVCQEVFLPILDKNKDFKLTVQKNVNLLSMFIGVDFDFEIPINQINNFIFEIELCKSYICVKENINTFEKANIFDPEDMDIRHFLKGSWKYFHYFKTPNPKLTEEYLLSLCDDIINIANRAKQNNEPLCGITM